MALPNADESRIAKTPGVCGGWARVQGTRIPVWVLVGYRRLGLGDAELLASYPTLRQADLDAAFAYYESHQAEIDAQMALQEDPG